MPPSLLEAAALILLLVNLCIGGITMAWTSFDARELSIAVFAPTVVALMVVSVASLFRIGRSRSMRARVLLGAMFLLFLGECGHAIATRPVTGEDAGRQPASGRQITR